MPPKPRVIVWSIVFTLMIFACGKGELNEQFVLSARQGDLKRVSDFLAQGADIEARNRKQGATALMWAAHEGHVDVMNHLLNNGADIDAKQDLGRTALWYAAQQGQLQAARVLIEHGASVPSAANDGTTPAMIAQQQGFAELAELLSNASTVE